MPNTWIYHEPVGRIRAREDRVQPSANERRRITLKDDNPDGVRIVLDLDGLDQLDSLIHSLRVLQQEWSEKPDDGLVPLGIGGADGTPG